MTRKEKYIRVIFLEETDYLLNNFMGENVERYQLKVLFVAADTSMGGSSRSLLQLMCELRQNYNVYPIVLIPSKKHIKTLRLEDKCKELDIPCYVYRFCWFKGTKRYRQYIKIILNYFIFYPIIIYKLRSLKVDLVHSNNSIIDIGAFISLFKRVKHVWHLREFGDLDFGLYSGLGKKIDSLIYRMGDVFIAISQSIKSAFSYVIPKEKIELVYNGVVPKDAANNANHENEILEFVMVGAVQKAKNQLEALHALGLLKKRGYEAHLNFIGTADQTYLSILKEYIIRNSLENSIKFWGERDDVPNILSGMDVGLMLSNNEAFGRVTVEYMMQNLAVIASNSGANPEIIVDGESGLLYQLGNVEELANKMCFCIENREAMNRLSSCGKSVASKKFISIRNTEAVYKIYCELLENS